MVTAVVLEVGVIDGHHPAEHSRLYLFGEVIEGISINKASFGGFVAVEIEVVDQAVGQLGDYCPSCKDRGSELEP